MQSVYRTSRFSRLSLATFAIFCLCFSFVVKHGSPFDRGNWPHLGGFLLLACLLGTSAVRTFSTRIVLTKDAIRMEGLRRTNTLTSDQIWYRREFREVVESGEGDSIVYYLELIPVDPTRPSIKIPKDDFDLDRAFWEWMDRIPDEENWPQGPGPLQAPTFWLSR